MRFIGENNTQIIYFPMANLRWVSWAISILVWFFLASQNLQAQTTEACLTATGKAAVTACRRELLQKPNNMEIRLALSDAHMALKQYGDAVAALRQGVELFPGDETIKKKLILAESFLKEQQWIEKQKEKTSATAKTKKAEIQLRLSIIRCSKLKGDSALAACNAGLKIAPNHPELLKGRGDVWLEQERFANAIRDYTSVLNKEPDNRQALKSLRLAQTKRAIKVTQCLKTDGPMGLKACDNALLRGATDEAKIQKRRAQLLAAMGKKKEAIKAYQAVAKLNPDDKQITLALTSLAQVKIPKKTKKQPPAKEKPATSIIRQTSPSTETKSVASQKARKMIVLQKETAASQPRRFSNAVEIPGITH